MKAIVLILALLLIAGPAWAQLSPESEKDRMIREMEEYLLSMEDKMTPQELKDEQARRIAEIQNAETRRLKRINQHIDNIIKAPLNYIGGMFLPGMVNPFIYTMGPDGMGTPGDTGLSGPYIIPGW